MWMRLDSPVLGLLTFEDKFSNVNRSHINKCSSGVYEDYYLLGVPDGDATEVDTLWVFDASRGAWYGPWTLNGAVFVASDIRGQGQDLYFGHTGS